MAQEPNAVDTATIEGIRSQISETRAEMSHTIAAIQTRLSPHRLMERAKATLRDATVGRLMRLSRAAAGRSADFVRQSSQASSTALDWARCNPAVPMAVAGAGAAAILARALWRIRKS
jgi:hypothetical protein